METTQMEASPGPWISALRHSHDRLRASVEPLGPDQLAQRSYPSEWTIAQVLSHLGSQVEIFGLILEAGAPTRPETSGSSACPPPPGSASSSWQPATRSRSPPWTATPRPNRARPSYGCPPRR